MARLPLQLFAAAGSAVEGRVMLFLANHERHKRVLGALAVAGLVCA